MSVIDELDDYVRHDRHNGKSPVFKRYVWVQWFNEGGLHDHRRVRVWDFDAQTEVGWVTHMSLEVNNHNPHTIARLTYIADDQGRPLALGQKLVPPLHYLTADYIVVGMGFELPPFAQGE